MGDDFAELRRRAARVVREYTVDDDLGGDAVSHLADLLAELDADANPCDVPEAAQAEPYASDQPHGCGYR